MNLDNLTVRKHCFDAYKECMADPKKLVKYGVLFVCSIVMVFQLTECFTKLNHPPITTHSHFDLNETISYPAITFCRDPPYKRDVMNKYNLSYHPKFTNFWRHYDYENIDMNKLFWEATYGFDEVISFNHGLDGTSENIKIISDLYFNMGQCHTVAPLVTTRGSGRSHGYSILLIHDMYTIEDSYGDSTPGWHVLLHEEKENFTEINMQTSGRAEYMYLRVGEEVEIKLTAQHFNMLHSNENPCSNDINYSTTKCVEHCQLTRISSEVGCTGPWMSRVEQQICSNYTQMLDLIVNYQKLTDSSNTDECGCVVSCKSIIYSAYVMCRSNFVEQPLPSSQIWLYYSSKMVTVFEERPGYDLTQFVADMGGSLGFLLGLSVLGLIGLLEKITALIFNRWIQKKQNAIDNDRHGDSGAGGGIGSGKDDSKLNKNEKNIDTDLSSTSTLPVVVPLKYDKY